VEKIVQRSVLVTSIDHWEKCGCDEVMAVTTPQISVAFSISVCVKTRLNGRITSMMHVYYLALELQDTSAE